MVRTGPLVGLLAAVALLVLLAATVGVDALGWAAGGATAVATAWLLDRALRRSGLRTLGPADRVTLARAVLVAGVTALVATSLAGRTATPALVAGAAAALALDAVDGWVARRTGTATSLGARFDMEVDAYLILVLSTWVATSFGPWVLAIGAARYLLLIGQWTRPWLRAPVPARYWCKVVAAIQGVTLTVAIAWPGRVTAVAVALALALLVESFGREVWWRWWRVRDPHPAVPAAAGLAHV